MTIEGLLKSAPAADLRLLLWEEEQQDQLKHILRRQSSPIQSAIIIVGPEGGFSAEEAGQFRQADFQAVSLGKRILRTETAGLIVLGILQYEFGDY
jgi:16S rRNA (uracil1498-N3)-methyltransferase